MNGDISDQDIRRLIAAEGYLELELPERALTELESVSEAGPYEAAWQLLKGEALKSQERFDEAIKPLQRAAELFPVPHNQQAWISLSECYRGRGEMELAELAQGAAKAMQKPQQPAIIRPTLNITIQIQAKNTPDRGPQSED